MKRGYVCFGYLSRSDQYVSNQYILDRNPRLSSYTIGVTYSDYISLLLVCGDFPLTSKRGVCSNLIPDFLDQVELQMDSNAIYYFELQTLIWLCSQPRIDLNSQSNFKDVLTRPYKFLSNTLSTLSTKQHALKTI